MKGSEITLARYWSRKAVIRRMLSQGPPITEGNLIDDRHKLACTRFG